MTTIPIPMPNHQAHEVIKHNIIIFGEAGSGKSSVVNMIVGEPVASVSNNARGCTFQNECYETRVGDTFFRIYDTAGLNEGDQGRVPHWKAIQGLYTLIRQLDGVSLLVCCMRGRVKENSRENWILFNTIICGGHVPIIGVITGLESEANLDDWWGREDNKATFRKHLMHPQDVACVVAVRHGGYEAKYLQSQGRLRSLIQSSHRREPWNTDKDVWFGRIYRSTHDAGICFFARKRLEFVDTMQRLLQEFIDETCMSEEESMRLERALLDAEKKIPKTKKVKKVRI